MQRFKKSLVALLAVAMVLSLAGPALAAVPEDVVDTEYEDAAVRLMALGVFKGDDKGNFNPEAEITRAEAVAIIIRALGLEQSAELMKGVTKFADVNADPGLQWATGVINIAVSGGIIEGYPDGNFGGRDNVKYEELAKMIIYALNYGVTVKGGVWPTAVLAKADELEILKGISVVPGVPIIRGLAAKMLDNSLDIKSLKQYGYGDLQTYNPDGDSLLKKMGYEEVKGRVTKIAAVEGSKLEDDEIGIIDEENDDDYNEYTVAEGIDPAALFGLEVKAWEKDDEIVFVKVKTAAKDIIYDTVVKYDASNDKVELSVKDKKYTVDNNAEIFVNFDAGSLDKDQYGRFVLGKGDVVFAHVFDFDNFGIVTDVNDEVVTYFDKNANTGKKLRLDRADAYVVYDEQFNEVGIEAVDEDSLLYWYRDGDDYQLLVLNNIVQGKAEKAKTNKLTIGGKSYTAVGTYSVDNDKKIKEWDDDAVDLVGEEVLVILNLEGKMQHVRGDAEAVSGELYGIVLNHWQRGDDGADMLKVFTAEGEEVAYPFKESKTWDGFEADADKGVAVEFQLNTAGEIKEITKAPKAASVSTGKDKGYVVISGKNYYFDDDTVLIQIKDGTEVKPALIELDDLKKATFTGKSAYYVGVAGRALDLLAFDEDVELVASDEYFGVVVDDPYYDGDDWLVEVHVFKEDELVKYVVGDRHDVAKGDLIKFQIKSGNELKIITRKAIDADAAKLVLDIDGRYITVGDNGVQDYMIASNAVIYEAKDAKKLGNESGYDVINVLDRLIFEIDGDGVIVALIVFQQEDLGLVEATAAKEGAPKNVSGVAYQKYIVKDEAGVAVDLLAADEIYQVKPKGSVYQLEAEECDADLHEGLMFKLDGQERGNHTFLVRHGNVWTKFVISH